MPFTNLKQVLEWRARAAAAVLLAAALTVQPSCSDEKERAGAVPTAQQARPPLAAADASQPGGGNTTMTLDPVADNLLKVLSDWSNREVAVLERSVTLKSMWVETHSVSQEYEREGVTDLRNKLRAHPLFKQRAEKLTRSQFAAGGVIQTQGQLYDFLAASYGARLRSGNHLQARNGFRVVSLRW